LLESSGKLATNQDLWKCPQRRLCVQNDPTSHTWIILLTWPLVLLWVYSTVVLK
jgi:hypothetical protein